MTMVQRQICPSMGSIRRSLAADVSILPRCTSRALSSSVRRLEEAPSKPSTASAAPANPDSRRARSATALKQITNLQNRRIQPGGLARGNSPGGQLAQRRTPRTDSSDPASAPGKDDSTGGAATAKPRFAKFAGRPARTPGSAPPEGQMVRAPGTLKISRNATAGGMRGGPNLGARRGPPKGSPRGGPGSRERGPQKREKKQGDQTTKQITSIDDVDPATTLSDGMVHQLLRLQRQEWDRVPYEPKYAHGSLAAQQLIHEGREFFKGESPPVKIWGALEKRIGVVGMFGAEAQLKVRRVLDGDEAPFGKEEADGVEAQKAPAAPRDKGAQQAL